MKTVNLKLLTVVCEPVLTQKLTDLIRTIGATGFTITEVRGEGSSHRHSGEVPDLKVKIEVLATIELAKNLMDEIAAQYFEDYSLIIYSTDAQVIRAEKF